jgi:hypothetical protein
MRGGPRRFGIRGLSADEAAALPSALAGALDLDEVQIVSRFHNPYAAAHNITVVRGARIFWGGAPAAARSLDERAHLAHELVHVWQYRVLKRTGLALLAERIYRYRLSPGDRFADFGAEQQAAIVEDYVRRREGAPPRFARAPLTTLDQYERLIAEGLARR